MTINKKVILGIITAIIIAVIGVAIIGFHLMGQKNTWDNGLDLEEVRYGDLVYFKENQKNLSDHLNKFWKM